MQLKLYRNAITALHLSLCKGLQVCAQRPAVTKQSSWTSTSSLKLFWASGGVFVRFLTVNKRKIVCARPSEALHEAAPVREKTKRIDFKAKQGLLREEIRNKTSSF